MHDTFVSNGASIEKIDALTLWVRSMLGYGGGEPIDVIRFIEIDVPKIKEGFYVEITDDTSMGIKRAYLKEDATGLVVSESIYEGASNGCHFSMGIILHEIGHLFMHSNYSPIGLNSAAEPYIPRIKNTKAYESAEWQANMFALSILYPSDLLKTYSSATELAQGLGVTQKQALRAFRHIERVHLRKKRSVSSITQKWVRNILRMSDPLTIRAVRVLDENSQLRLFG